MNKRLKKQCRFGICCALLAAGLLFASGCAGKNAPQQGNDSASDSGTQPQNAADAGGADMDAPGTVSDLPEQPTGDDSDSGTQPQNPAGAGTTDGMEAAKNAALAHAGLDAAQVTFVKQKLDYDDGAAKYEIEFVTDTEKYEYEMRESDLTILEYSRETRDDFAHHNADGHGHAGAQGDAKAAGQELITDEEALAAALAHAGLTEDDAVYLEMELDYDDGRYEYEIEFYAGNMEYEYEIDAVTGEVLKAESEIP